MRLHVYPPLPRHFVRDTGVLLAVVFALSAVLLLLGGCGTLSAADPDFIPPDPPMAAPGTTSDGALYPTSHDLALFADLKPRQVGDIVTVLLIEQTDAQKSAETTTGKTSSTEIAAPTIAGQGVTFHGYPILSATLSADRDFNGSGASSQSNKLNGSVTVTVVKVLPNGNLMVRGEKRIGLNRGEEYVQLSGVIRPADIAPDNSVLSSRVADARIVYTGNGEIADANSQGWLSRIFNSFVWPF